MGGGPKKPTLSQLERRMAKQRQQEGQAGRAESSERGFLDVIPPSLEEVAEFVRSQPYVTPSIVSERFGIRLSIAKQLLHRLSENRVLRLVAGDNRLRIYTPVEPRRVEEKKVKEKPKKRRKK